MTPAQPASMAFDPCREWLGIDVTDLADPHRVLGLPPGISDADAIARAAAERLESLSRIAPGPYTKAHAALMTRVGEACGKLRAGSETTVAMPSPPVSASPVLDWTPPVDRRRRRASGGGTLIVAISLLAAGVAAIAFFLGRDSRTVAFGGPKQAAQATPPEPAKTPDAATAPAGAEAAHDDPRQPELAVPDAEAEQRRAAEAEQRRKAEAEAEAEQRRLAAAAEQAKAAAEAAKSRRDAEQRMAAEAERQAQEERRRAEEERKRLGEQLDAALGEAYQAIRRQEFDTAIEAIDEAADKVGDDADAAARVERWRLFATYAREFPAYQQKAFAAANAGREYEADGIRFSVIEITPEKFVYKVGGRIERMSPGAVDPRIEMAIVEAWFAADGRAANHLFLGARWLSLDPPDVRRAGREWRIAGSGGEKVAPLVQLLEDPVIRQAGR